MKTASEQVKELINTIKKNSLDAQELTNQLTTDIENNLNTLKLKIDKDAKVIESLTDVLESCVKEIEDKDTIIQMQEEHIATLENRSNTYKIYS